jgi:L-rhamnose mutarotase
MARYAFLMECKPGCEEEYAKRHQAVHPELLEHMKQLGVRNYSIFMDGNRLIAFLETDDFQKTMQALSEHPANRRWQAFMSDILVQENGEPKMRLIDNEVFFMP